MPATSGYWSFGFSVGFIPIGGGNVSLAVLTDSTGSMPPEEQMENICLAIIRDLAAASPGSRFALADYKDDPRHAIPFARFEYSFKLRTDFVDVNSEAATDAIASLPESSDGGDGPECALSCLMTAFDELAWRGGRQYAVLITDDLPVDPEDFGEHFTTSDVVAQAQRQGITILAIHDDWGDSFNDDLQAAYDALAVPTGGQSTTFDLYDEALVDDMAAWVIEAMGLRGPAAAATAHERSARPVAAHGRAAAGRTRSNYRQPEQLPAAQPA